MRTAVATLTMCVLVLPAYAKYSGGTGEPNDPYQIATAADLIALGEDPNDYDKHFILTADIDLDPNLPGRKVFDKAVIAPYTDPHDFLPYSHGNSFTGVFDGQDHAILHLAIAGQDYLGLFGRLDSPASISNLGLEVVQLVGVGRGVGALAGHNVGGSIHNCYSTGSVRGSEDVGGLVGDDGGIITASHSSTSVRGDSFVGGLVGAHSGIITASCSTGSVRGNDHLGGLVGGTWCCIAMSYSNSPVRGNSHVGGLAGNNSGHITASYSSGSVKGSEDVGGLVGWCDEDDASRVIASFWDTQASGQATSAGGTGKTTAEMQTASTFLEANWDLVDEVINGTCDYWQVLPGEYPQLRYQGDNKLSMPEGLGTAEQPYLILDARDLGTIWLEPVAYYRLAESIDLSGIEWSAAVIPWFGGVFDGNGLAISHLTIAGESNPEDLGLFGTLAFRGVVTDLAVWDVSITGIGNHVGGLAGESGGRIVECCTGGSVRGRVAGGLVGYNFDCGNIANCYSEGSVRSSEAVGGLVGCNRGSINRSYSKGLVSCVDCGPRADVGGLVGIDSSFWYAWFDWGADGTSTASFWDIQTSGQSRSAGGTGKTTAEMQTAQTFLDAGWDFVGETANGTDDIWWILEGKDYPRLWWELPPEN